MALEKRDEVSLFFEESTFPRSRRKETGRKTARGRERRRGKKREIVSALSANDVGKKEDGEGGEGGGNGWTEMSEAGNV